MAHETTTTAPSIINEKGGVAYPSIRMRGDYSYPSYDAVRYPDARPPIPLIPVPPDFRTERWIKDMEQWPPGTNQLAQGTTLNSLPPEILASLRARLAALSQPSSSGS